MVNMKKLGVNDFTWTEFYSRTSLQFSDSFDSLGWPVAGYFLLIHIFQIF